MDAWRIRRTRGVPRSGFRVPRRDGPGPTRDAKPRTRNSGSRTPISKRGHEMIGFELTEDQKAIRNLAHDFAAREMRPVAAEYDEKEEIPWDVVRKAHEIGLTTYDIPEEYGGGGVMDMLTHCLVNEEISWGCAGIGTSLHGPALALPPLLGMGTPEQL